MVVLITAAQNPLERKIISHSIAEQTEYHRTEVSCSILQKRIRLQISTEQNALADYCRTESSYRLLQNRIVLQSNVEQNLLAEYRKKNILLSIAAKNTFIEYCRKESA